MSAFEIAVSDWQIKVWILCCDLWEQSQLATVYLLRFTPPSSAVYTFYTHPSLRKHNSNVPCSQFPWSAILYLVCSRKCLLTCPGRARILLGSSSTWHIFLCDLGGPQPVVAWSRILVPSQRLRPVIDSEDTESQPLDQCQWQGPGSSALQKKIHTKMESSETSQVFIRKKGMVHVDRHIGRLRESCALLVVWIT